LAVAALRAALDEAPIEPSDLYYVIGVPPENPIRDNTRVDRYGSEAPMVAFLR